MSTPTITAADVKALRDQTGAGMMDCKKALSEADGDIDKAIEILRVKARQQGRQAAATARPPRARSSPTSTPTARSACSSRSTATPTSSPATTTSSPSPGTSRCTSPRRRAAVRRPRTRSREDAKDAELRVFEQQAADKPENVRPKIAEGKLRKWMEEVVLLNQVHVNADKYDGKTIEELRAELAAKTGENVVIRRFARFAGRRVSRRCRRPPSSASCSSSRARR